MSDRCWHGHRNEMATDGTGCAACLGAEIDRLRAAWDPFAEHLAGGGATAANLGSPLDYVLELYAENERLRKQVETLRGALASIANRTKTEPHEARGIALTALAETDSSTQPTEE